MDYEKILQELGLSVKELKENRMIKQIEKGKHFKKRGKDKVKVVRVR